LATAGKIKFTFSAMKTEWVLTPDGWKQLAPFSFVADKLKHFAQVVKADAMTFQDLQEQLQNLTVELQVKYD
jgi:hypothetical protein